jgi:ABC-type transport system substrate-binding protein
VQQVKGEIPKTLRPALGDGVLEVAPRPPRTAISPSRTISQPLVRGRGIIQAGSGAFGNAGTRLDAFVVKGGTYVYGSYPDIDLLFQQQAAELDHQKRQAILRKMQQLVHERAIFAPIWQLGFINGVGPRVGQSGFGQIAGFPYTAPYQDITLKAA